MRAIWIPSVRQWVSIGAYVNAVKTAKEKPDAEFPEGLTTWWPTTGQEIVSQFMRGVHDRINQAIPYSKRGLPHV